MYGEKNYFIKMWEKLMYDVELLDDCEDEEYLSFFE